MSKQRNGRFEEQHETDADIDNMLQFVKGRRLCRYAAEDDNAVNLCEKRIAEFTGAKYALAVNSGTSAIYLALYALGIRAGDEVLLSGLTFVSVPSAIIQMGAIPVLVDITEDYTINVDDLKRKITKKTKLLLVTHMRSNLSDLRELQQICNEYSIFFVEDCAHSMGAYFDGVHTGRFGVIGCFSTQSKLLNSGEGGLIITDSLELMTKMIILSGCYEENYKHHLIDKRLFEEYRYILPCFSMRMSCLNAGYMLPLIATLSEKTKKYRDNYRCFHREASNISHLRLPGVHPYAAPCTNSIMLQFVDLTAAQIVLVRKKLSDSGLNLVGYTDPGNCRFYQNWHFIRSLQSLPVADRVLKNSFEFVLPNQFDAYSIRATAELIECAILDSFTF